MGLKQIGEKIENCKATQIIRRALGSCYFPLVTAAVCIACYYLGWDIVNIWYLCLCGTAIMICCKDVSPVLCIVLFLSLLPSAQHSPRIDGFSSGYLVSPPILAQEIIGVTFFGSSLLYRLVAGVFNGNFKITPMFWTVVALSVAFMLGGLFYSHYTILNFVYGLALAGVLIGFYIFSCGNIKIDEKTFIRIAYYFIAVFGTAALFLAVAYLTYDGVIVDGKVMRGKLVFGWGTYNQLGLLLAMAIPAWFYLAGKHKYGFGFLLGGLANLVVVFLSMSRQAMVMGTVIFVACCVWLLIWDKGKKRIINASIMGAVVLVGFIGLAIMHDKVLPFFSSFLQGLATGNGRTRLWEEGMQNFLHKPLFGVGFFDPLAEEGNVGFTNGKLSNIIPRMCHNTFFQLISSCGLVGLVAYVVHRTQTVISVINNITNERVFVVMLLGVLLLMSLLDNHIFYFIMTAVYTLLVSLLAVTEKKDKKDARLATI